MNFERNHKNDISEVFIIPSTHWDREWYRTFQDFRIELVKMIDRLIDIFLNENYFFMLDGQTIVLEDYFEIRPERKDFLLNFIRNGRLEVGPWYLLPDEWLIGQESIIRNLEVSYDLAKELDIPQMQIAYLPDQFGHSRAIPQILRDMTSIDTAVIWRGVGPEIATVPFSWKSDIKSTKSILGIYMPYGYGNAAMLPTDLENLTEAIKENINDLLQYSPVPVFQLMHGTDHQIPDREIIPKIEKLNIDKTRIQIGLLSHFVDNLQLSLNQINYVPAEYSGEFRSSARAPLLQDTYSARMWIKQWNQRIEDLLVHYAEPLCSFVWLYLEKDYPTSYLNLSWKWLLKNHPHDSICGCSIDQTHEEMKSRFYWSESIAEAVIKEATSTIKEESSSHTDFNSVLVFNPTNNSKIPQYFEFEIPAKVSLHGIMNENGEQYEVQPISSSEDIIFEDTLSPFMIKTGLKMLPGRKLMNDYINEVSIVESKDSDICEIRIICDKVPIGDFDVKSLKEEANALIESQKYKRFHVKATRSSIQKYASVSKLNPWSFSVFNFTDKAFTWSEEITFSSSKNHVENKFYELRFNRDGSFNMIDKTNGKIYSEQHKFEDWGDRGDEYTFGRIGPEYAKVTNVKRKLTSKGSLFCEIQQDIKLKLFTELHSSREKRAGKTTIPIRSTFRFYRDLPRIDIKTELINHSKDHRLRICFDLPFESIETFTSTHFGTIKRRSEPYGDENYIEAPSGIQAQKRYIRIDDKLSDTSVTLINKGLPEVELVRNSRLALTLLRCIGYLSRSDFPERPLHAGPFLETPGAQEIGEKYVFEYSFMIHSKLENLHFSDDHSESFSLTPLSIIHSKPLPKLDSIQPVITLNNPWIRISSIRIKNQKPRITLFNLSDDVQYCEVDLHNKNSKIFDIQLDEKIKGKIDSSEEKITLKFDPFEIRMCILE